MCSRNAPGIVAAKLVSKSVSNELQLFIGVRYMRDWVRCSRAGEGWPGMDRLCLVFI